jgi:hypothetical protein
MRSFCDNSASLVSPVAVDLVVDSVGSTLAATDTRIRVSGIDLAPRSDRDQR